MQYKTTNNEKPKMNFFFSRKQIDVINGLSGKSTAEVLINGEWVEYSEMSNNESNWDDAILLCSVKRYFLRIDGIEQDALPRDYI